MLEQRRAQQKGYITLREAADLSNYTPDYVGQLIRAGKIRGEQVYSNVAWVTTEEEIRAYLSDKSRTVNSDVASTYSAEKLMNTFTRFSLYTLIALFSCALLVMVYIFSVSIDDRINETYLTLGDEVML